MGYGGSGQKWEHHVRRVIGSYVRWFEVSTLVRSQHTCDPIKCLEHNILLQNGHHTRLTNDTLGLGLGSGLGLGLRLEHHTRLTNDTLGLGLGLGLGLEQHTRLTNDTLDNHTLSKLRSCPAGNRLPYLAGQSNGTASAWLLYGISSSSANTYSNPAPSVFPLRRAPYAFEARAAES